MVIWEPRDYFQNRPFTKQNGAINQNEPTSFLDGRKAKEEDQKSLLTFERSQAEGLTFINDKLPKS